jgi:hypothetical protein
VQHSKVLSLFNMSYDFLLVTPSLRRSLERTCAADC